MDNRLEGEAFDAALHLLDRQVIDSEGLLVCKVDDLEVTLPAQGPPAVTRVLTGPAALIPRMSTRSGHLLRKRWISLGIQYAERDVPLSFQLQDIRHLGSAVELSVGREGLLDRQPAPPQGVIRRRMGELLGMKVETGHPELRGKLLDVRLGPGDTGFPFRRLVIGPGRPGSLLGYDRGDFDGPWLVQQAVKTLHRHIRLVDWDAVEAIDWEARTIRVNAEARVEPASLD